MIDHDDDLQVSPKKIVLAGSARWKAKLTRPIRGRMTDRLRALVLGQAVSTGDEFEICRIVEIVPPDEPAIVGNETVVEFT